MSLTTSSLLNDASWDSRALCSGHTRSTMCSDSCLVCLQERRARDHSCGKFPLPPLLWIAVQSANLHPIFKDERHVLTYPCTPLASKAKTLGSALLFIRGLFTTESSSFQSGFATHI
eukprot:2770886-Amphidinium_carterae.2